MFRYAFAAILLMLAACQTLPPPTAGLNARQVAVLEQNGFRQVGDEWHLGLGERLLFATDESRLVPSQLTAIGHISAALLEVGIKGARVEGHTDSTGTREYNLQLSLARARAVKQAMVGGGMDADAVHEVGLGQTQPVESNHSAAGRQENRRVVIIVTAADTAPPAAGTP